MTFILTKQADEDLTDIYLYGYENFGELQAEKYFYELEDCFKLISESPLMAQEFTEFTPAVRIHHHKSHLIVYLVQNEEVLIIRILHKSMKLSKHLQQ